MSFTNDGARAILNSFFRSTGDFGSMSGRGILFLGLSASQNPSETGGSINEVSGGGYSRLRLENNFFIDATDARPSVISNSQVLNFARATGNWGDVASAFIAGSVTGGTIYFVFPGTMSRTINSGDELSIPIGNLTATLD